MEIKRFHKEARIDQEWLSSFCQFTSPQILSRQAELQDGNQIAIREKSYGIWQAITWPEYLQFTKQVCLGLMTQGL